MLLKHRTTEPVNLLFPKSKLQALLFPLIIEQAFAMLVGMADSVMVSGVGEAALSGVSLVDMLVIMIFNLFSALATGGSVVASQYLGAKRSDRACQSATQLLLVALFISLSVMAIFLLLKRHILTLFFGSIDAEVMEHSLTYLTIVALSFPFLSLWSAANALFRAAGNSKITMQTSLIVNIINVCGNALLIYGFKLGVAGAAFATLFARAIGCIISTIKLTDANSEIFIDRIGWKPDWQMIKSILRIGIPSGLENTFFQFGRVLVLGIISTFGTAQIAANSVANTFSAFTTIAAQAIGLAMITVVGQCVGAKDIEQTTYYIKKLMKMAYTSFFGCSILITALMPLGLWAYNLSAEATGLAWILYGIHTVFGVILWPASFTIPNALRATNNVKFTMIVAIISMVLFRIIGSYVVGLWLGFGAIGVWCSMVLDWICRVICFLIFLFTDKWKKHALLELH